MIYTGKKILALLLSFVLYFSLLPVSALAEAGTISASEEGIITRESDGGSMADIEISSAEKEIENS